jgi:hypothetical protein
MVEASNQKKDKNAGYFKTTLYLCLGFWEICLSQTSLGFSSFDAAYFKF